MHHRSHRRLGPSLLDAVILQRLLGSKLPVRTRGSGCFHVLRHQNTEVCLFCIRQCGTAAGSGAPPGRVGGGQPGSLPH